MNLSSFSDRVIYFEENKAACLQHICAPLHPYLVSNHFDPELEDILSESDEFTGLEIEEFRFRILELCAGLKEEYSCPRSEVYLNTILDMIDAAYDDIVAYRSDLQRNVQQSCYELVQDIDLQFSCSRVSTCDFLYLQARISEMKSRFLEEQKIA